jgi:hypothetical protein
MYDQLSLAPPSTNASPARPLRLPATVGVVQVGEVAPPQPMIDALRKEPAVFSRIETLPLSPSYATYDPVAQQTVQPRPTLDPVRRLAADAGLDYLLLVGGSIDRDTSGTPLSLLDITIVGAFAVPSQETRGTAKAVAALIDVPTGRVIANSSAEARRSSLVPSVSVRGERVKLMEELRDDVVKKLGAQVLADAKTRAAFGNAAVAAPVMPSQLPAPFTPSQPAPAGPAYRTADGGPF